MPEIETILKILDYSVALFLGYVLLRMIDWQRQRDRDASKTNQFESNERKTESAERQSLVSLVGTQNAVAWEKQAAIWAKVLGKLDAIAGGLAPLTDGTPQARAVVAELDRVADDGILLAQFEAIRTEITNVSATIKQRLTVLEDRLPDRSWLAAETKEIRAGLDQVLDRMSSLERLVKAKLIGKEKPNDRPIEPVVEPTLAAARTDPEKREAKPDPAG